jgi:uncharacterized RDD family membrane protein YckC
MANGNLPAPIPLHLGGGEGRAWAGAPDPISQPQAYDGVISRRIYAWMIDFFVYCLLWLGVGLAMLALNIVTLGLLSPISILVMALLPLFYHALCLSGSGRGTLGMRAMNLVVQTMDGARCDFFRAGVHWILFHLSVGFTGGLILLFALFNPQRRTFHDYFTNVIVLRRATA